MPMPFRTERTPFFGYDGQANVPSVPRFMGAVIQWLSLRKELLDDSRGNVSAYRGSR
jgi:hypothetical protein